MDIAANQTQGIKFVSEIDPSVLKLPDSCPPPPFHQLSLPQSENEVSLLVDCARS